MNVDKMSDQEKSILAAALEQRDVWAKAWKRIAKKHRSGRHAAAHVAAKYIAATARLEQQLLNARLEITELRAALKATEAADG